MINKINPKSIIATLMLYFIACFLWAQPIKVDRVAVPVTVTVANQYWVETISVCNTSGSAIPLTDIEFNFNYAVPMPSSIWGQPWAAWRVASQQNGKVVLLGGTSFTLMPDPNCRNPLTIQFNASPDTPAPTGPFVFKADWQPPTSNTGNLTVNVPSAPAAGLSTPQVTVQGMGKTFQQAVNWGTAWPLTNLAVGSYQVTASNVSNANATYQAAPITVNVTASQTVQANIVYSQTPPPPVNNTINNSAWVYDMRYNDDGSRAGNQPGLHTADINSYNMQAGAGHKLTQLFPYGGDMEMYCQGSGGTSSGTTCNANNMVVSYVYQSTAAYYNAAKDTPNPMEMIPIVDGVVGGEYLKTFNSLTREQANIFADNVAKIYCADNLVAGVQFDLEPFDINQTGQAYFYEQIAKNFAGQHSPGQPDPYGCVNASHPKGRTFSVFTFSGRVNAKLGEILNRYNNGYVIDSLYDLGSNPGGVVSSVSAYTTLVNNEVSRMMANAKANNVKYQFGIPAQASVHEFESVNGKSTGYAQLDYVKAAINAINSKGARTDPLFRGINLWGFNQRMFWGGKEFTPSKPNTATRNYLATAL